MKKILVTYQVPKEGLKGLYDRYEVTYPDKQAMSKEEAVAVIDRYDGLFAAGIPVDKELMDAGRNLKIISNYGAGYDNIDVEYATAKGIVVTNIPDAVTESTAELAFGLMIDVMRGISQCDRGLRFQKDFKWGMMNHMGNNLYGKTLGIIGMGRIGRSVARRAAVSGMKIIYHNRTPLERKLEEEVKAVYLPLQDLLERADVISLHAPLTKGSHHLLGREEFELMKPSVFIVNTARGPVIDEKALVEYIKKGKVAGAGLDVFEEEPVISPELLTMEQVVLTPHIGTDAVEVRVQMTKDAAENIIMGLEGKRPVNVVNPEVYRDK